MAHLFIQTGGADDEWRVVPLLDAAVTLSADLIAGAALAPGAAETAAVLLRSRTADGEHWLAVGASPTEVRINGRPLTTGLVFLRDRDEVWVAGLGRAFFSTERLAEPEIFAGAERAVYCARCRQPIDAGQSAVRCPSASCRLLHHEDASVGLLCWSYAGTTHCAMCDQPNVLGGPFRWSPEAL